MKKTIYQGHTTNYGGLFNNESDLVRFIETLGGEISLVLSEEPDLRKYLPARSCIYHIGPQGLTLKWQLQSDKMELGYGGVRLEGAVVVDLFGNPDTLSEMEKKILEEDKRRRLTLRRKVV